MRLKKGSDIDFLAWFTLMIYVIRQTAPLFIAVYLFNRMVSMPNHSRKGGVTSLWPPARRAKRGEGRFSNAYVNSQF